MPDPEETGVANGNTDAPADDTGTGETPPADAGAGDTGKDANTDAGAAADAGTTLLGGENKPQEREGAPEEYAEFTVEGDAVDATVLSEFTGWAKENNLSQAEAQAALDLAGKNVQAILEAQTAQWTEVTDGWANELKSDAEFGGQHFDETVERANRALRKFGDESLIDALKKSGYCNHPGLIKLLTKVDRVTSEDVSADGPPAGDGPKAAADVMYDNS